MSQEGLTDAPHPRSHPESGPLFPVIAPVADFLYPFCKEGGPFMTIHIQMLQEIATNAQAMAEAAHAMAASMQAIVDDCARQLARRKAAGESEEAVMNEAIGPATTSKPSAPPTTIVELRAFVAERSTPENRPKIKAILERHGVRKLTELPESRYAAVMDEVAAL